MPFNNAGMVVAANALRAAAAYGQLHSGDAGAGTANTTTAARQAIAWTTPTGSGNFGLAEPVDFTNGEPDSAVYSMTVWSAATAGTCYGQFVLAADSTFDGSGGYSVTALDFTGTTS